MTPAELAAELAAIRERCEKATKGPWFLVPLPWRQRDAPSYVVTRDPDPHCGRPVLLPWDCDEFSDEFTEDDWIEQADNDLDFAAHARSDIPKLLALVARQQAVVEIAGQIKARVDAVGPVPSPAFWAEIAALVVRVNALTTYQDGGA